MKTDKRIYLLLVLVLLMAVAGWFIISRQSKNGLTLLPFIKKSSTVSPTSPSEITLPMFLKVDDTKFKPGALIQGLGVPTDRWHYAKRYQIMGWVEKITETALTVKVNDTGVDILLPKQVRLNCLPLYIQDAQGNQRLSFTVTPTYRNPEDFRTQVEAAQLAEMFPVRTPIGVIADRKGGDLETFLITGFGCTMP